jgi:hypothetical protein
MLLCRNHLLIGFPKVAVTKGVTIGLWNSTPQQAASLFATVSNCISNVLRAGCRAFANQTHRLFCLLKTNDHNSSSSSTGCSTAARSVLARLGRAIIFFLATGSPSCVTHRRCESNLVNYYVLGRHVESLHDVLRYSLFLQDSLGFVCRTANTCTSVCHWVLIRS